MRGRGRATFWRLRGLLQGVRVRGREARRRGRSRRGPGRPRLWASRRAGLPGRPGRRPGSRWSRRCQWSGPSWTAYLSFEGVELVGEGDQGLVVAGRRSEEEGVQGLSVAVEMGGQGGKQGFGRVRL